MDISRLDQVPLRELWKHEARGFPHWLAEHLDYLGDSLGANLSLIERQATGDMTFAADSLVEDEDGNHCVIENQLEKTNHDHLGKITTCMSTLDTKSAVGITSKPCPASAVLFQKPDWMMKSTGRSCRIS